MFPLTTETLGSSTVLSGVLFFLVEEKDRLKGAILSRSAEKCMTILLLLHFRIIVFQREDPLAYFNLVFIATFGGRKPLKPEGGDSLPNHLL